VKRILMAIVACFLLLLPVQAQEPTEQPASQEEPAKKEGRNVDDLLVEGVFTYSPKSYRDPFVSPFDLEQLKQDGKRLQGIQGMSINEIVLQGVIKSERGYEAFVLGSDNKFYWIKAGDELYDGKVLNVGFAKNPENGRMEGAVVFRQDVDDPNQLKPYRDITKYLNK